MILFLSNSLQYFNRRTENNMNTKQFSSLFVLVLFKSQVFISFPFNLMIDTQHDLIKQMFWFLFNSQISNHDNSVYIILIPMGIDCLLVVCKVLISSPFNLMIDTQHDLMFWFLFNSQGIKFPIMIMMKRF